MFRLYPFILLILGRDYFATLLVRGQIYSPHLKISKENQTLSDALFIGIVSIYCIKKDSFLNGMIGIQNLSTVNTNSFQGLLSLFYHIFRRFYSLMNCSDMMSQVSTLFIRFSAEIALVWPFSYIIKIFQYDFKICLF